VPAGIKSLRGRDKHEMLEALYPIFAVEGGDLVGRDWDLSRWNSVGVFAGWGLGRGRGYILFGVEVVVKSLASK
jgi:hypothetical protein